MIVGNESRLEVELGRRIGWVLPISGAVIWTLLALASWRVRGPLNFVDRDDGIITLAHAKNLAEYGSISVGRFGDRVNGFSTPLHFIASLPYFAFGGTGYALLNRVVSFVAIAVVGALTGTLIATELRQNRALCQLVALLAAGLLQFSSWRFFGWHFSGMENPYTTVLLLAVLVLAPSSARSHRSAFGAGVLLGLLSLARLDAVSLALPLLLVLLHQIRSFRGRILYQRVLLLVVPPAVIGGAALLALTLYFGSPFSTTVENRDRSTAQLLGVSLSALMIAVATLILFRGLSRLAVPGNPDAPHPWKAVRLSLIGAAGIALGAAGVVTLLGDTALRSATTAVYVTGGVWATVFLSLAWAVPAVRPNRLLPFTVVLIWVPLYEVVFGPTRIDTGRVVSSAVPVLSVVTVVVAAKLVVWASDVRPLGVRQPPDRAVRWTASVAALGLLLIPIGLTADVLRDERSTYARTFYLGWQIEPRPTVLLETADTTVGRVDRRIVPIVAAADLGKLSFAGRAQVVDLGSIGDPLYLQIMRNVTDDAERARLMQLYLGDVLPPDTWMLHAGWGCPAATLTGAAAFAERYEQVDVGSASVPQDGDIRTPASCDGKAARVGVWTLREPQEAPDLQLAARLLDGHVTAGPDFFAPCLTEGTKQQQECFVRLRAYRRAFPGLDGARRAEPLLSDLDSTPAGLLVSTLIRSPEQPGWWIQAFDALEDLARTS